MDNLNEKSIGEIESNFSFNKLYMEYFQDPSN
jgi:hypothetical protein